MPGKIRGGHRPAKRPRSKGCSSRLHPRHSDESATIGSAPQSRGPGPARRLQSRPAAAYVRPPQPDRRAHYGCVGAGGIRAEAKVTFDKPILRDWRRTSNKRRRPTIFVARCTDAYTSGGIGRSPHISSCIRFSGPAGCSPPNCSSAPHWSLLQRTRHGPRRIPGRLRVQCIAFHSPEQLDRW
jgi:hypothetical protein